MNEELKNFFNSIGYIDENNVFASSTIESATVYTKKDLIEVVILNEHPIDIEAIVSLLSLANEGINDIKIQLKFKNKNIESKDILAYFLYFINKVINEHPSLSGIKEGDFSFRDDILNIEVSSKAEKEELKKETKTILKKLNDLGIDDIEFNIEINKEKEQQVKEEITAELPVLAPPELAVIMGNAIEGDISDIDALTVEEKNIIVEAYIFGIDTLERDNINIITLKLSDKKSSISAKIFRKEPGEYREILEQLETDKWYRLRGNIEQDNYANDLVLVIKDIEKIKSKENNIVDKEKEKRIELHLHTFMSTMDSVVNHTKLLKFVKNLGHKCVAITDHNALQAFPDIYNALKDVNKDAKESDKLKVLYGAEVSVVNDDTNVIVNLKEHSLLKEEYVVFDVETTGLRAGKDTIIEIGAVKIKDGNITDRFNEFIAPGRKLPKVIVELTGITDEMLEGAPKEEEVLKRFLAWVSEAPMIAHNAQFDISFISSAMDRYKLGVLTNTVLDTMSLARMLNPEWPNHKLQTLTKKYNVPWDETQHHRADYDAEGTALAYTKMARILDDRNIETTIDLNHSINKDELVKFSHPFHITLLAKDQVGLKNLFKIISLANTKYLFKNDQPKIPRHEIEANREGLLIGSACINGEVFRNIATLDNEEISNMMRFYDYIEVQPPSAMSHLLTPEVDEITFRSEKELENHLEKIIHMGREAGKIVCATGDVHHLTKEDKIYREIIAHQKINGRFHPLNRRGINIPDMRFLTTKEMLEQFSFLEEKLAKEIVIDNTHKIADMVGEISIIKEKLYTPKLANSDEDTRELVFSKARELYGDPLPPIIVERIDKELNGIIDNGYSVLYMIAYELVKKSNEDGYFVGSRGSVGSSFVATMMGITEVNGLPPHYLCPKCKISLFEDEDGLFSLRYRSGYDMDDKVCECGTLMKKDGQDIPFSSFLGWEAEKVPDIDLNFSGEYQAKAHNYTKELFGEENVYRAGTIGTVATKTAIGYVLNYVEDKGIAQRRIETERLALGCTGVKRTTGQHPGGIIVIPRDMSVYDFTAFQYPADEVNSNWYTTHFAFSAIHDNVLKLDILGHDDPTMLKYLEDSTKKDILSIPFDDAKVLSIFSSPKALGVNSGDINCSTGTLGIPEFGTSLTIRMLEEIKPKTFSDLVKISGLAHGTNVWNGNIRDIIIKKVADFDSVIGCREDLIADLIAHGVPGFEAFGITEFVRKNQFGKNQLKFPEKWSGFVDIMREHKVPEWYIESARKIEYLFPKAHASAYVMMGYRVAWFKVHLPLHYYAAYFSVRTSDFDIEAMLGGSEAIKSRMNEIMGKGFEATDKEKDVATTLHIALEMTLRGYSFKGIDIEKSEARKFVIDEENNSLILPLSSLDGLGESAAGSIIEQRKERAFMSIEDLQQRAKINTTTIDKMKSLGILKGLPETSQLSLF